MIELREYQGILKGEIHQAWSNGHENVLAESATGSGKTVLIGSIVKDQTDVTFVIAHRKELVGQISTTLAKYGIKHQIVASAGAVRDAVKSHVRVTGVSWYDPNSIIVVASVDTLPNRIKDIQSLLTRCKTWITDECFVAGTMVDGKSIEDYKIGDPVNSFNESTGKLEEAKVTHTFKNKAPERLIEVKTVNGHTLVGTYNHPFFTKRGWISAVNLTTDDEVLQDNLNWTRIDDVTVQDSTDGFTYNLEVTPNNTYVANGIVVHNCHHILVDNKWGKACDLFPNAKGLGVTATPIRADGKGLGRHANGVFDTMVNGPSMRWLIDNGMLSDYRIFCPPSDLDLQPVKVSKQTGDYNAKELKTAIVKSHIMGDVVAHYLKYARGKQGVTFATDVDTATTIAEEFVKSGVKAAVVSAKTPDAERTQIILNFTNKLIQQIVNVDLFGEGFDVPAIEVVSMARPTQSFALYSQQFGRALRILDGKTHAIIIDHVGNVLRHGLPDAHREWSLDARDKRSSSGQSEDVIPVKACPECAAAYEKIYKACPYCGHEIIPLARNGIEYVDGDLTELDAETLAKMRGDISKIDEPVPEFFNRLKAGGMPINIAHSAGKKHHERQEAVNELRESMAVWSGHRRAAGDTNDMIYKRFYFTFGTDVGTAQTFSKKDALAFKDKIDDHISRNT
jgi:DNA repair protein RadD